MRTLAAALLVLLLGGCLNAPAPQASDPERISIPPTVGFAGTSLQAGNPGGWTGRPLQYQASDVLQQTARTPRTCEPASCEHLLLTVDGDATNHTLRVMARWSFLPRHGDLDLQYQPLGLRIQDPSGRLHEAPYATYSRMVRIVDPKPGLYHLYVQAEESVNARGGMPYEGIIRLDPHAPAAPGDRLPDLALTFIGDLRIEKTLPGDFSPITVAAPWTRGCGLDEFRDEGSRRCLRFSASIANVGPGPIMLFFRNDRSGPQTPQQCIVTADGTRLRPAGTGAYHDEHGHFHQDDVVEYKLHAYDLDRRARGAAVGDGKKFGWGFASQGVIPSVLPEEFAEGVFYPSASRDCPALAAGQTIGYGLPRGWHDPYLHWRNGQYVEISGLADGVYELVVIVNPKDLILEASGEPNTGSLLFRLRGDTVETLSTFQRDFEHLDPARATES